MKPSKYTTALPLAFGISIVLFLLTLVVAGFGPAGAGDIPVYAVDALKMFHGQIPYLDFNIEYLPGVLPFFLVMIPLSLFMTSLYSGFYLQTIVVISLFLAYLYSHYGKRALLTMVALMLPLLQFFFLNLDIFSALSLFLSIYLLQKGRYSASAILLAATTLIKTYPGVALLAIIWFVPAGKRIRYLSVFGGLLTVVVGGVALFAPEGLRYAITYHTGRPVEVLSTAAGIGYILDLFGSTSHYIYTHASVAALFPGQSLVNQLSTVLLALGLFTASIVIYPRRATAGVVTSVLLLLILYIALFKVGSPQYMVAVVILYPLFMAERGGIVARQLCIRLICLGVVIWLQFIAFFATGFEGYTIIGPNIPLMSGLAALRMVLLVETIVFLIRLIVKTPASAQKTTKNIGKV